MCTAKRCTRQQRGGCDHSKRQVNKLEAERASSVPVSLPIQSRPGRGSIHGCSCSYHNYIFVSRHRHHAASDVHMLHIEVSNPSPEPPRPPTLSDLSRNASVISSSSSSSSTSSIVLNTPRPRPIRTFSSPRSLSRDAPPTPRSTRPPAYLAKELGLVEDEDSYADLKKRAQSRSKSRARTKSRNSSAGFKLEVNDFEFGEILGEG